MDSPQKSMSPRGSFIKLNAQWRIYFYREVQRKLIHLTGLSIPISIILLGQKITVYALVLSMVSAIIVERYKLQGKIKLPAVRDYEQNRVSGYVYYVLGALLTVLLFPPAIAVTAILMLSLGDAASGIIGSIIKGSNVRANLLEGKRWAIKPWPLVLSTFLICLLVGYLSSVLVKFTGLAELEFAVYLAGSIGATAADAIPLSYRNWVVDDNFTIPICTGIMMTLAGLM